MKKIILTTIILAAMMTDAFAGSLYFAPTVYLQDITSTENNFRGLRLTPAIGYGDFFGFYYLAAEIFASPTPMTLSNTHDNGGDSLRIAQEFGASFIPGILLGEGVITYLRLGVVSSKFRAPSTTKTGGQFGIGLQTSLTTNWSLRGEYVYTAYSGVQNLGSPEVDAFGLGVIYKFDGLS